MADILQIEWRDVDHWVDQIPCEWFERVSLPSKRKHVMVEPSRGKPCFVHCEVKVEGREVVLDYAPSEIQKRNNSTGVEVGQMKLIFASARRTKLPVLYWAPNGRPYKKWPAKLTIVSEIGSDDVDLASVPSKEGKAKLVQHLMRERDPTIAKKKKRSVLKTNSCLKCEACGFDFAERYQDIGNEFCEVHHRVALGSSSKRSGTKTSLEHLAILCSNCHRMIHRTKPMESVAEFSRRLL